MKLRLVKVSCQIDDSIQGVLLSLTSINKILTVNKRTLVLGASTNSYRYSNMAIRRLVDNQQDTLAFGLKPGNVSGVNIDTELISYDGIDTVTLYLNPKRQEQYYDYIISLKPKRVIFNPGTENPEFYQILRENNIQIEVACTLVLLATDQY